MIHIFESIQYHKLWFEFLRKKRLPEDTTTVSCEMVRKVRFHSTIDTLIAVLGSPGPVVTVLRLLGGPVMITDSLMVKETAQRFL